MCADYAPAIQRGGWNLSPSGEFNEDGYQQRDIPMTGTALGGRPHA